MTSGTTAHPACRVVVLISGNGSNLQALLDYPYKNYQICRVVSNRADAFGLQRARNARIGIDVLDHKEFTTRETFDDELMRIIDSHQPDLVVLAGFMRILSSGFVQHYTGRLLNIHPSLLPMYKGTNTHQRVLEAGDRFHGVSVHFVTEELDGGPVVAQVTIPVLSNDDKDSLAQRVATQEHRIYPEVVSWFAAGRLRILHGAACLDQVVLPAQGVQVNINGTHAHAHINKPSQ